MGFHWQAGRIVVGGEFDIQWSGQQNTTSVGCNPSCAATEAVRIRSISTGRARVGYAFDWLLPYVTGGVALVNAEDTLTLSTKEGTQIFPALSNTNFGYAVGGGFDIALSSNLSARLEYLRITTNISSTAPVPNGIGVFATEAATYRDNIVRIGLNYALAEDLVYSRRCVRHTRTRLTTIICRTRLCSRTRQSLPNRHTKTR
jgi:outer membrane immunogenic protein